MDRLRFPKVQRTAFTVASLPSLRSKPALSLPKGTGFDQSDEKSYWLSKTPYERLRAVELMRQIIYGYDPSTSRLQRVLEITQRSSD